MNVYSTVDDYAAASTASSQHRAFSTREHRKSNSLTGFGSSFRNSDQKKAEDEELILKTIGSQTSQKGVWVGSGNETPKVTNDHPLLRLGQSTRPPKMPHMNNVGMSSPFGRSRKHDRHRNSSSLGSTDLGATTDAMTRVGSPLGACFVSNNHVIPPPPPPTFVNKRDDEPDDYHRHTLGSCRVDSMVLSKENSPVVGSRIGHRKSSSLGPEDMLLLSGGTDDGMSSKKTTTTTTTTTVTMPPPPPAASQSPAIPIRSRSMTASPQVSSSTRKSFTGSLRARASSLTKLGKLSAALKTPTGSPNNSPKSSESPRKTSPLGSPKLLKSLKSVATKSSPTSGPRARGAHAYSPLGSEKPPVSPKQRNSKKAGKGGTSSNDTTPCTSPKSSKQQRLLQTDANAPPLPPLHSTNSQTSDAFAMELPLLAKPSPTSFLTDASSMALRSTEQDPAKHQMSLPARNELLLDARLCQLLETSRQHKFEAWSSTLCGMSQLAMQEFAMSGKETPETVGLTKEIVRDILNCGDMVTVVAYIAESVPSGASVSGGGSTRDKREILICECQKRHQLIVVYRGTNEEQQSVKNNKSRNGMSHLSSMSSSSISSSSTKDVTSNILHADQPVAVQPWLKDAYFGMEGRMAATLDRLTDENPFCDIVFTGSGFGGGLAQLAAFRLASMRPTMRIACNVFGSPIVGQRDFRQMANTLPNLKVMRVEYGLELTSAPSGDSWTHVGHSIVLHPGSGTSQTTNRSNPPSVVAYRFEKHKPLPATPMRFSVRAKPLTGLDAYIRFLAEFPSDAAWVRAYVGENVGNGVRGSNNEKRNMV